MLADPRRNETWSGVGMRAYDPAVSIDRFVWSEHATLRLAQRRLERSDVEEAIRASHDERKVNEGEADWLVQGMTPLGVRVEVIYDHPIDNDETAIRIVSAWRLDTL